VEGAVEVAGVDRGAAADEEADENGEGEGSCEELVYEWAMIWTLRGAAEGWQSMTIFDLGQNAQGRGSPFFRQPEVDAI